jgi:hypothetical protein
MLNFLVQSFYQPLFSLSFPFSNFPLVILFPSVILLPLQKLPTLKSPKQKNPSQSPKAKPQALLSRPFINHGKWGGAETQTCIPASLNTNTLGETTVLLPELCQSGKSR